MNEKFDSQILKQTKSVDGIQKRLPFERKSDNEKSPEEIFTDQNSYPNKTNKQTGEQAKKKE